MKYDEKGWPVRWEFATRGEALRWASGPSTSIDGLDPSMPRSDGEIVAITYTIHPSPAQVLRTDGSVWWWEDLHPRATAETTP